MLILNISFNHADNNLNKLVQHVSGKFLKKDSTGFIIQILNEELDGGKVLKKGNFHTQSTYSLNKFNVLKFLFLYAEITQRNC